MLNNSASRLRVGSLVKRSSFCNLYRVMLYVTAVVLIFLILYAAQQLLQFIYRMHHSSFQQRNQQQQEMDHQQQIPSESASLSMSDNSLYLNFSPLHSMEPVVSGGCRIGGCSSNICRSSSSQSVVSTCEWKAEYNCYRQSFAICQQVESDNQRKNDENETIQHPIQCEWLMNEQLRECLANTRKASDSLLM